MLEEIIFTWSFLFILFFCLFVFLQPHPRHMEVPGLGVESDLQLPAYATAIAMPDPSHACDLHHSSRQHRIPNPLSEARDQTCILIDTIQICFCWAMTGTPVLLFLMLSWIRLSLFFFRCLIVCVQNATKCWFYILQLYWIHWLVLTVFFSQWIV